MPREPRPRQQLPDLEPASMEVDQRPGSDISCGDAHESRRREMFRSTDQTRSDNLRTIHGAGDVDECDAWVRANEFGHRQVAIPADQLFATHMLCDDDRIGI